MHIENRVPVANSLLAAVPVHIANRMPVANSLLAALPRNECRRLIDAMELVAVTYGEVLYEPGQKIRHVYFPNDSIVSLLTLVDRHQAL